MDTHFLNSNSYAHPKSLVSCDWLAEHLQDPSVRVIESNEDVLLYDYQLTRTLCFDVKLCRRRSGRNTDPLGEFSKRRLNSIRDPIEV